MKSSSSIIWKCLAFSTASRVATYTLLINVSDVIQSVLNMPNVTQRSSTQIE